MIDPCLPIHHSAATLRAWGIWRAAHPWWHARSIIPACVKAAIIGLPMLVPGATTEYGSRGGSSPAGLGYPLPVAELPYGGAGSTGIQTWGAGQASTAWGGSPQQFQVARFLPPSSPGVADVGLQTWVGPKLPTAESGSLSTQFPTTSDHPTAVPEPGALALLVGPVAVAVAMRRRG